MPELPEVETIRRELHRALTGRTVRTVVVRLPKILKLPITLFCRRVVGTKVLSVHRRAKLVLIHLSRGRRRSPTKPIGDNWTVIIHLKMSGQLIWRPARGRLRVGGHPIPGGTNNLPNIYTHVIISFTGGALFFNDQRQFGYIKLLPTADLNQWLIDQGYGPEPLGREFTARAFFDILKRHRRKRIKPALLDQTVLAGLGNIYADEALHYAQVKPTRRIASLRSVERQALYRGIRSVLRLSLRHKGTSADQYVTTSGEPGRMLSLLKVYGRAGQRCRRCGGTIKKIVLAGRGTHFCPDCQR